LQPEFWGRDQVCFCVPGLCTLTGPMKPFEELCIFALSLQYSYSTYASLFAASWGVMFCAACSCRGSASTTRCTRTVFTTKFQNTLQTAQRAFRPPFTSVPSGAEVLLIVIAEHTSWAKADGRTISVSSFYNSRRQSRMPA